MASVSRALNGLSSVTPETRDHIRSVADRLGYVPHAGARSLSLARTNVVGVVLPDLHGEFFSELVRGMDRSTTERGYQMLFCTAHADAERARHAVAAMHGRVDGLILMAPHGSSAHVGALLPSDLPAVLINSPSVPGRPALRVDNRAGAAAMARHLVGLGRRRLVHVSGPPGNIDARERVEGFLQELARLIPGAKPRVVGGDFQEASGSAAIERLLAARVEFDAVFAANDGMAMGVLRALKTAGVDVPGQVAVAGFDDVPLSRFLDLTTLRVSLNELGDQAVARLCDVIAGNADETADVSLQPELLVRASTAGAR